MRGIVVAVAVVATVAVVGASSSTMQFVCKCKYNRQFTDTRSRVFCRVVTKVNYKVAARKLQNEHEQSRMAREGKEAT